MAARPRERWGADALGRLAALESRFPCREAAIKELLDELHPRGGVMGEHILVYGPPATGKTAVVRSLLATLQLCHAYINCQEVSSLRSVLSAVVAQLSRGKRLRDDSNESQHKCDSLADLRLQLRAQRGPCVLVLDHAHRLAGSEMLAELMRLREGGAPALVLVLVGREGWAQGTYLQHGLHTVEPKEIHFRSYRPQELQQILEQQLQQHATVSGGDDGQMPAFRQFLGSFVPAFCRASNNLLDLQAAAIDLFKLYMQPLREGRQMQSHQLYARIKSDVQERIAQLQLQAKHAMQLQFDAGLSLAVAADGNADTSQPGHGGEGGDRSSSKGLSFELPYLSKFLLLAAYVASRNKPTTDRAVFDPTYGKRARRDAQAQDRQVEAAVEAKLRGPHSFALERLFHVFYALYSAHNALDEDQGSGGHYLVHRVMQQADVLQQVSSLVALRLLDQCGGDLLEGQLYRCNLGEAAAHALAANVRLRLSNYLRLA